MAEIRLHQLRLVVFPIIYRVSAPSQVVGNGISAINSIKPKRRLGTPDVFTPLQVRVPSKPPSSLPLWVVGYMIPKRRRASSSTTCFEAACVGTSLNPWGIWVLNQNRGVYPPKWMVYNGKPLLKLMIWGYPYFWKHPCLPILWGGADFDGKLVGKENWYYTVCPIVLWHMFFLLVSFFGRPYICGFLFGILWVDLPNNCCNQQKTKHKGAVDSIVRCWGPVVRVQVSK